MNTLAVLGKFYPMTKGHLEMIKHYAQKEEYDKVYVFVCYTIGETMPVDMRFSWVERATKDIPKVEVKYILEQLGSSSDGRESDYAVSKTWAKWLHKQYPEITNFGGSEPYVKMMADSIEIECDLYDVDRSITPISATMIRSDIHKYKDMLAIPEIYDEYVFRVAVVGLDSCGKSTLVRWLSNQFDCEVVDEYGRAYCSIRTQPNDGKDEFLGMDGLEEITYGHHKLVIASVRNAWKKKKKLVIVDTEHYVTRGFAFRYFNSDNKYIKDACNFQHYDGMIYCNLLPLEDDGTRRDVKPEERIAGDKQLWEMITSNVKDSKIIRVPVDMETRKQMSVDFINSMLKGE